MSWRASTTGSLARLVAFYRKLPRGIVLALKPMAVLASLLLIGLPQLQDSLDASRRYAGVAASDWKGTNNALESAKCLRKTGYWLLQACEKDRIVPFAAEDPGQVLLLSLWGRIADRDPTVMDAARLNLGINAICLLVLALTLLSLGAFATSIVLLALGPAVYLQWFGTAPHWALIGMASVQVILPLAIIARTRNWLNPSATFALLASGLLMLGVGALMREAIGLMALLIATVVGLWSMVRRRREVRHLAGTAAILLAIVLTSQSSQLIVAARDWAYSLDTQQYPATHGMSHTLYIGLGAVENKFGIRYDDAVGQSAVAAVDPSITSFSRDYHRVLRELYLRKWQEDPAEVIRIYLEKLKRILSERVLVSAPPLAVLLLLTIPLQWVTWRWAAADPGSEERLSINLVALGFVGLLIVQCVLSAPAPLYALPIGAFILVVCGIALENLVACGTRLASGLSAPP